MPRGLEGVVVADTEVGDVRGDPSLLPLPPVLRRRPGTPVRLGHLAAVFRRLPAGNRRRATHVRRRGSRPCVCCQAAERQHLDRDRRGRPTDGRAPCRAVARRSPRSAALAGRVGRQRAVPQRRHADPAVRTAAASTRPAARASRTRRSTPRPTISGCSRAAPQPESVRAIDGAPHPHHRPRLQRLDVHRPGPCASRPARLRGLRRRRPRHAERPFRVARAAPSPSSTR